MHAMAKWLKIDRGEGKTPEETLLEWETAIASRQEMETLAKDLHGRYVELARQQIEKRFSV